MTKYTNSIKHLNLNEKKINLLQPKPCHTTNIWEYHSFKCNSKRMSKWIDTYILSK